MINRQDQTESQFQSRGQNHDDPIFKHVKRNTTLKSDQSIQEV